MKTFVALLFLLSLSCGSVEAQSKNDLEINILKISPSGGITLRVSNHFKEAIRLWRDSNSWGAARWRVLMIRKGRLETFFQNPDQNFTRNIPAANEIAPSAQVEQKLDLNAGNWCGLGHCSSYNEHGFSGKELNFEPGDIIVVTYDVPYTDEAVKRGVWYGVAGALMTVR